ncbi:capsular polysaccharide synthesis protein [Neomicrococcus aestuarii]|nr:capsular polysaccharide synthesis protein [Neomicrococcus aestuarii]
MKHQAHIALNSSLRLKDKRYRFVSKLTPYFYESQKYEEDIYGVRFPNSSTFPVNHLAFHPMGEKQPSLSAPNQLFMIWAGDNALPPNRLRSIEVIREFNLDLNVHLVTPNNLNEFVLPEHPLHKAYEKLSFIHRSDYLRAYLMHHHGGAYMDIKPMTVPWKPVIESLNADIDLWAAGPSEISSFNTSPAFGPLGIDQRKHFSRILFQSAFAFKPGSSWTEEWLDEVERRLSYFDNLLDTRRPKQPFGLNPEYPIPWSSIHGYVFGPLALKYSSRSTIASDMKFSIGPNGYR